MSGHFLLQGVFPTQVSNPSLLHCRQILYRLSYQGSPYSVIYLYQYGLVDMYFILWVLANYSNYLFFSYLIWQMRASSGWILYPFDMIRYDLRSCFFIVKKYT